MNAQELQQELSTIDPAAEVVIAVNGALVPVTGISSVPDKMTVLIRGRSKDKCNERFTTQEDGVIGHLRRLGLTDNMIGEILGRDGPSVKGRRRRLGLS